MRKENIRQDPRTKTKWDWLLTPRRSHPACPPPRRWQAPRRGVRPRGPRRQTWRGCVPPCRPARRGIWTFCVDRMREQLAKCHSRFSPSNSGSCCLLLWGAGAPGAPGTRTAPSGAGRPHHPISASAPPRVEAWASSSPHDAWHGHGPDGPTVKNRRMCQVALGRKCPGASERTHRKYPIYSLLVGPVILPEESSPLQKPDSRRAAAMHVLLRKRRPGLFYVPSCEIGLPKDDVPQFQIEARRTGMRVSVPTPAAQPSAPGTRRSRRRPRHSALFKKPTISPSLNGIRPEGAILAAFRVPWQAVALRSINYLRTFQSKQRVG